ncbi:MAG TPA: hypothetical protein VG106_14375, partial [Vicinamibacterales bacterium]|nr:hypothetical protein [Vicinamibacterales bacterium]
MNAIRMRVACFTALFSLATIAYAADTPFASSSELRAAMEETASTGDADAFWRRVLAHRTMPLVSGERAVFLWRGAAKSVDWRGDFSGWQQRPETAGRRLGATDIWVNERMFPRTARLDY